jgi:hypothetical protein
MNFLPLDCILLLGLQTCSILVSADFTSCDVWTFCTEMSVYFLVILLFVIFLSLEFFPCGPSVFCILLCYHAYHICSVGLLCAYFKAFEDVPVIFIYVLQY